MLKNIFKVGIGLSLLPMWLWDKLLASCYKRAMRHCGHGVYIRPMSSDLKGLGNMSIGDGSSIPKGSTFYCTEAPLTIGRKVIFGPKPTIITGDHRIDIIGHFIMDNHEKLPDNDAPVLIEDDVWTGANITILKRCNYWSWFSHSRRCCGYQVMSSILNNWWNSCKNTEIQIHY